MAQFIRSRNWLGFLFVAACLLCAALALQGCGTVAGLGQDLGAAARGVASAVSETDKK
jgi:predicted small secreted protein